MKKGGANPPSVGTETETIMLGGKIKKGEGGDMVRVKGKMFKITSLMKKRATFGLTLQGKK